MSRENDIQWMIYRELIRINHKLDTLISGEAEIEEDLDELLPSSAVSATLEIVAN